MQQGAVACCILAQFLKSDAFLTVVGATLSTKNVQQVVCELLAVVGVMCWVALVQVSKLRCCLLCEAAK